MYSKTANRPPQWPNQRSAPTLPPQNVGMNGYQAARQGANTGNGSPSTQNPANGNIQNGGPSTPTNSNMGNQGGATPNQTVKGNRNGNQAPQQGPNRGNQNYTGQNPSQGMHQTPQGTMNGYSGQQPYQGQNHQHQAPGNTQGNWQQNQRNDNFSNLHPDNRNPASDSRNVENNRRSPGENGKTQKEESGERTISKKIWKVNTGKKVIDFNDMLIPSYLNDYAFIHGRGGKEFAPNSTIELVICDYSKGRGENSVTVRYRLDVEEIPTLLKAAQDARLGYIDALSPNGEFVIAREKNNPYSKGDDGYVKVGKLTIRYCKWDQQGKPNGYPWFIYIENFEAPLKKMNNGASTHQSNKGRNHCSAFINLTREDFDFAMVAVNRFVTSWEHYHLAQSLPKAYQMLEEQRRKKVPNADA